MRPVKIFNIMLSRDSGGLQRSFLDYSKALKSQGFEVKIITSFISGVQKEAGASFRLPNLGPWDFISRLILKFLIFLEKPDLIIAHGNRAIKFSLGGRATVAGVAHNYSLKLLLKCDYVIALTLHMKNYLTYIGFPENRIKIIRNCVPVKEKPRDKKIGSPIFIKAAGRFVPKKSMDIFLKALKILKDENIYFKASLAGEGKCGKGLKKLANSLGLSDSVDFPGWFQDKTSFFADCDIFCLPSSSEPFGIILLEAMERLVPTVATKTEGPSEIIEDGRDGLLCEKNSPEFLAEKILFLIKNPDLAQKYAENARKKIEAVYSLEKISKDIGEFVKGIYG